MSTKKTTKKVTKSVKRQPKKKAVKKTTKKVAKKSVKKSKKIVRAFVCAEGEQCFWTTDGSVLSNLEDLRIAFGSMEDEVFLHHVTKEKNDFAQWVEDVLGDAVCADALRSSKKPSTARAVVVKHLKFYDLN